MRNDAFGIREPSRLAEYGRALPAEPFDRLYKLSVMRNPYERLVSACFSPRGVADRRIQGFDRDAFGS